MLSTNGHAQSISENNGFILSAPYINTKRIFLVKEKERPLVDKINSASNSISRFLIELMNLQNNASISRVKNVLPNALEKLKLPPFIRHSSTRRYTAVLVHDWQEIASDKLEFIIDFADPGHPSDKYTDSYIFLRIGQEWFFESHGHQPPGTSRIPQ